MNYVLVDLALKLEKISEHYRKEKRKIDNERLMLLRELQILLTDVPVHGVGIYEKRNYLAQVNEWSKALYHQTRESVDGYSITLSDFCKAVSERVNRAEYEFFQKVRIEEWFKVYVEFREVAKILEKAIKE